MISLRFKLAALVVGSFLPALVGAIATERAIEQELLEESASHIKEVGRHFDELLDEYERHALLAVEFATHDPEFDAAVARGDKQAVQSFVDQMAASFKEHHIIAADATGKAIAQGNAGGTLSSLRPGDSPAFELVQKGQPVSGLFPVGEGYGFVDAAPVRFEGRQVGALALLSPISEEMLNQLSARLDADLVLSVGGKAIAQSSGHLAPHLRTSREEVLFEETNQHLFAVESFHPRKLQQGELSIELSATRDVSELRASAREDLYRHLSLLGLSGLAALLFALGYAKRIAKSVEGISHAAQETREGNYSMAPPATSNDEIGQLSENYNEMVGGLKERDRLKETFGRYVTREVAEHLMSRDQQLGGELLPVTVLFSDIRSFTSISERMNPSELLDYLNEYFTGMVECILENQGVVDKFIGDAIMAVFGAPVPQAEDPLHAVRAAIEMRNALVAINERFAERGLPEIRTGIGLHFGQVVAGNMGHSERMEYTVIGDTVNVASRLEGMTKQLEREIVISGELYELVKEEIEAEPLREIHVKGREEAVMVYGVIGVKRSV